MNGLITSDMMDTAGGGGPLLISQEEIAQLEAERQQKLIERATALNAMGESLAKDRSEAINARQSSGIEKEWQEDEEFYAGIDDANRGESSTGWRGKPPLAAPAATSTEGATRSTVFPNITAPYTDAAAARIADMLLPTDDRSWSIKATPIPDVVGAAEGKFSQEMLRQAAEQNPGNPEFAKQKLAEATQEALKILEEANQKAERASQQIDDWHVECQWHANVRQVIEDAARIGVGVLKGPIPVERTKRAWVGGAIQVKTEIVPASKWIDPWNFYPAPGCGENIHNGSHVWERDYLTVRQLRKLIGQDGYLDDQIAECIKEGPIHASAEYKPQQDTTTQAAKESRYEIWYRYGSIEREALEAAGCDCSGIEDPHLDGLVTMVNNRVVKAAFNPLETGEFPYDVFVWRKRTGHWSGIGVARMIRTPQRIVTAATRNLMDNAGIAAGPMIVFRQGVVRPANKKVTIAPRKIWFIDGDVEGMEDATKAIGVIKVDMLVNELLQIVQFGLKMAEDVTGMPMLLQGQLGKAPDTVGGMQMLNNNASTVLRRLARLFDDRITEPHVRRYYSWLLEHGKDDQKGDFTIDARGSSALVERDIQNQELAQMASIVVNPVFRKDPIKWIDEYLKSRHLDPRRFDYDDDKWQEIVSNMAQGPQDPRLALAQFNAEVQAKFKQMDQAFEASENQKDRELELIMGDLDGQISEAGNNAKLRATLETIKARFGETVLKLREMRNLQRESAILKPPVEPMGRAPNGKAFQQ